MSSFIPRNLTEIEAITGCTFACVCNTVFRMFSCLQINCQPFYLRQLLKFHQFDWLIEIYLQTEGQITHHKMVSLQPMSGFSPLFIIILTGTSDQAFHAREIPANNIIHVTDSLAVRQTRQNTFLFFSTYFSVNFCHRLRFSINKN